MPGFEFIGNEEFAEVEEVFTKSKILFRHSFDNLRNGVCKVRDFEKRFAEYMGVADALAVTSGSAALRVGLAALGVGEGDEVITQSFTFVATVEAIIESGAQPVIAEVDETLNMNAADLESKITPKTKVIIAVHMLGTPANLPEILRVAEKHKIKVLEDTAWGCGGRLNDRHLGTMGDVGTFSFDFAKTMTTGEGGMVICKDPAVLEKAKAYHDHGHENNPKLPRWEDSRSGSGFNYRMMELQGAVGLAQLRKLDGVIKAQRENRDAIAKAVGSIPGVKFRKAPENSFDTADALVFFVQSHDAALKCRNELLKEKIGTKILPEAISWHFAGTWDHMPKLVARHGDLKKAFPKSAALLDRAVAIPILGKMEPSVPERVERALQKALHD